MRGPHGALIGGAPARGLAFEAAPYFSPDFASLLAQPGLANTGAQLAVLAAGAVAFVAGHLLAARLAGRAFERVDI